MVVIVPLDKIDCPNMDSGFFTTTEPTEITERGETDPLTQNIIGAAIEVHRGLGPGLLESAYEACLIYELRLRHLFIRLLQYTKLNYCLTQSCQIIR